jgi:CRP/FNR family transcriptional regulator, cyclic AMP receptor protein
MVEERLQGVRFFEFLTEEEREEFAESSETAAFGPGEKIIEEGGDPGSLFILTSGMVEVSKRVPTGGDRILARIDAADGPTVVGERGLLGESGASATVRAAGPVEVIKIPRATFRRMIAEGRRLTRLDEEVVEAIRELESKGETDLEAFRDKLITDWAI